MVEIESLKFQYPGSGFRLSIQDLTITQGEKVAIIGPSGSGKTTLLSLVSGIIAAESGEIKVLGESISSFTSAQRRDFRIGKIGQVFQQFELVEYLRARDNITLPFLINASLRLSANVHQQVEKLAQATGIEDKLDRFPRQLSQGEQQRVAICRALITRPRLLLADEPTGNLDPANKFTTLELLFEQCSVNNQSLVIVTHDTSILDGFDRVVDFEKFVAPQDAPTEDRS